MGKKVDMFQASKEMGTRVSEFMRTQVWGITLRTRLRKEVEGLEAKIGNLETLKGSILDDGDKLKVLAEQYQSEIEEKKEKVAQQIEDEATFTFTKADNEFFSAYKKADSRSGVGEAIKGWTETYNLKLDDTDFLEVLVEAISGSSRLGASGIIRSGATKFTKDKRSKKDVLIVLYGKLAEKMLAVGTLKPEQIPEDIRKAYAPKKKG